MIRIQRCTAPPGLLSVRDERVASARASVAAGQPVIFDEYDIVKSDLARMQHNKCCYCEKREEQAKYRDVEHYRPKMIYWWLAWTWENLLFSCVDCNREHKRSQFPLSPGDRALVAEQQPPGAERPLILDPSDPLVDPCVHIEFRREKIQGRERWTPYGMTGRGWRTIDVCGLARPGLLTLYKAHVDEHVRPRVDFFEATSREGRFHEIFNAWGRISRGLLGQERPFRALSYDALNILVPSETRDRYRLELVRPTVG